MKKFLKCLWGGLVSTLTLLLLALVIWAFLTLAVVVVVVFSPVLFVLFVHLSYKEKDDEEN
jgi:Flp pilus assembly protein TadB